MPRPESALNADDGPVQQFAAELRRLRQEAGNPGYRELARLAHFSVTTLATAAAGRRLPSLAVTLAFVDACGGDRGEWEERWRDIATQVVPVVPVAPNGGSAAGPPYRGLAAYQVEDAARFFGRERLVAELVERVRHSRFLAVFGPSGCGKSSLLRAGLVPAVGGAVVVMTPGADPVTELTARLADTSVEVLVVDQFEETFTLCRDPARRKDFIAELLALTGSRERPVTVVIGVRADFYAACAGHPELAAALRDRQTLVPPMTAAELRDAVVKPAEQAGLMVEGTLVSTIVAEVAGTPGALPLASHALLEAWRRRRGNAVTLTGYDAAGGLQGALAKTAEAVYSAFDAEGRATCRAVMTRLVTPGDGVDDTRRRVARAELDLPGVGAVLDRLAAARLVTLDQASVEIAHEALIGAWPRLRRWLSADRDGLRIHRLLTEATDAWLATRRDPGALYRGVRLAVAREWAAAGVTLTPVEQDFLDASVAFADRELAAAARHASQIRLLAAGLAVLLGAASIVGVVAVLERRDAVHAQRTAVSRQLAVQALTLAESDPGTAMLLSVQAWRTGQTLEARTAVLSMAAHRAYRGELPGHDSAVSDIAFSPDGRTMLSVGEDQTLRVWDTVARREVAVRNDHRAWLLTMALSPDGKTIATGGDDNVVVLWNTATLTPTRRIAGHSAAVNKVVFSPDGTRLATAGADGTVQLWDVATGGPLYRCADRTQPAKAVAFSPDGTLLAIAYDGVGGTVVVRDAVGGAVVATLTGHDDQGATGVAFSPDGRLLATGGDHTTAIVWDVATWSRTATFTHGKEWGDMIALRFSPDSRTLATAGADKAVVLWDVEHRVQRSRMVPPGPNTYTLAFDPRGGGIASAGEAGNIVFWDLAYTSVISGSTSLSDVAYRPDGGAVATGGPTQTVVWDARSGVPAHVYPDRPGEGVNTVAFSPDGGTLAFASQVGGLVLRDTATGAETRIPIAFAARILDFAFSPDGRLAASANLDGTVTLWDVGRRVSLETLAGHRAAANGVAFSLDGRMLVTGGHDSAVFLWDVERRMPIATLTGHTGWIQSVAFSPDGRYVASAATDHTVVLWDAERHTRVTTLTDHDEANTGAAFSPDSRTLAYTSADNTVVLWDIATRAAIARLAGHTGPVQGIAFRPDGRTVATAAHDGSVIFWALEPGQTADALCGALARDLTRDQWRHFLPDVPYERTCT